MSKSWDEAFEDATQTMALIMLGIFGGVPVLVICVLAVAGWWIDWPIGLICDIGVAIVVLPLLAHRYLGGDE